MPASKSPIRTQALAYACLGALFLFSVTHFALVVFDSIDSVRHAGEYVRPPFYLGDANWGAVAVQPEADSAGMKFADAVLSVNGRPVDGYFVYYSALREARVGDRLRVQARVQYQGDTPVRDLSIELQPLRAANPLLATGGGSLYVWIALSSIAMPLVCIALGFWVAAVRIRDRSAWLLLAVLVSLATFSARGNPVTMFGREGSLPPLLAAFHAFFAIVSAPALMLFGIVWPERLEFDRRFPWLKWIVIGYLVLVGALEAINVGLWVHHLAWGRGLQRAVELLTGTEGDFGAGVQIVALFVCAASLGWKTMTAPSRDARRRLLLLDLGAVTGVAPLIIILVASRFEVSLPVWSHVPLVTMMLAFPLSMAYVIVVHRAMDVRVVIRQGLQYLLARGGIRVVQIGLLVAVSVAAMSLLSGGVGIARVAVVVAGMVAIVAISSRFADRLRGWVDRRFFREAYETDAILSDLATKVRTMVETGPLLETVATRIAESLHVPRIAILLDDGGALQPAFALGYPATPNVSIPLQSVTAKRLRQQQHAIVQFDDENSWVQLADEGERASLQQLKSELLLPLSLNEKLLGIMSLGAKQSEEPFSRTDIRLLDTVAAQTGLALENGRLMAAIASEASARAKQTRDKIGRAHV